MKSLHDESDFDSDIAPTAQLVVDTGVRLARLVRWAVRSSPPSRPSMSGLRALSFVSSSPRACVSDVAEYLLVGVPTASKLVDELVERGLLRRSTDERDRRRVVLATTPGAQGVLESASRPAQEEVALLLARLDPDERARIRDGMQLLREVLRPEDEEAADA